MPVTFTKLNFVKKAFTLLLFTFLCTTTLLAQTPFYPVRIDSSAINKPRSHRRVYALDTIAHKRFGRASIQLGIAELTPFIVDHYIRNVDFSKISWQSTAYNLNPGHWAFDNDPFGTNQFAHPYHGSQYFSAFRSNGYTFWQSVPAAFAGSYLWETFGEKQAPAPNDFINTSFGGAILGEVTYRLSNKIVNDRTRGFKRQMSEVFALMVNPMNGFTRILDGKWGRVMGNSKERDSSKIYAEFDMGLRRFNVDNSDKKYGIYGHARLIYGTAFENYKTPFSNITVNAEVGEDDSSKVNVVSVYGSLVGWKLHWGQESQHVAILSANYDYIHNVAFSYSAQSLRLNIFSNFVPTHKVKFTTSFGAGPILLGAVPDPYGYIGRFYDYATGFGVNAGGTINIANKLTYGITYRGGWLKTINGNQSHYFLNTLSSELSYMFIDHFSLAVEPGYFALQGYYSKYPDVDKNYPYLRASLRYSVFIQ